MSNKNKDDVYEVIDGEYYVDGQGECRPDRREQEPETFSGAILMPGPGEPVLEEGQFFVDGDGNISPDRRCDQKTESDTIILGPPKDVPLVEFR